MGRTRIYFAGDEKTLLDSGRHTKPRHIPRYAILGYYQLKY